MWCGEAVGLVGEEGGGRVRVLGVMHPFAHLIRGLEAFRLSSARALVGVGVSGVAEEFRSESAPGSLVGLDGGEKETCVVRYLCLPASGARGDASDCGKSGKYTRERCLECV